MGMHGSITMLNARVKILREYVDRTLRGEIAFDHEIMRQIGCVCAMLPAIDTDEFRQQFLTEYNDALLVTYLSTVTKAVNVLNDVADKFALASTGIVSSVPAHMARHAAFFA
jgi:COP9 signalosome complex subunit 6